MINKLKELNKDIKIYSIHDEKFKKYGKVIDFDSSEFVEVCKTMKYPESGAYYQPSVDELEKLPSGAPLREILFGGLDTQFGICHGYNDTMNGLEYHKCSEINIAVTPVVLILGLVFDMEENEYDSSKVEAFYLEEGDTIEMFSTTLHYCPCQVSDGGFSSVVLLPKNTNTPLESKSDDKLLIMKNKWLICHDENEELIQDGAYPGIHGADYIIKYS